MTEQAKTTSQPTQTQVRDLTADELDQVTGGATHSGGLNVLMADGSVRNVDAGDYAVWQSRYGSGL